MQACLRCHVLLRCVHNVYIISATATGENSTGRIELEDPCPEIQDQIQYISFTLGWVKRTSLPTTIGGRAPTDRRSPHGDNSSLPNPLPRQSSGAPSVSWRDEWLDRCRIKGKIFCIMGITVSSLVLPYAGVAYQKVIYQVLCVYSSILGYI